MKRFLTLSAAALALTAATAAHATSNVTSSATTVKTTTTRTTTHVFPTGVAFPATAHEYLLKDGTFLVVDGTTAWTIDTGGAAKVAAEDGDHILSDDKVITTRHGYVVGGVPELGTPVPGVSAAAVTTGVVAVPVPVTTTSITTTTPATTQTTTTSTTTRAP